MKILNRANTVGALMIAAGAVVTGASVTSGAMASDDGARADSGNAVVVGSVGVAGVAGADGADGEAYQCFVEGVELPQLDAMAAVETGDAAQAAAPLDTQLGEPEVLEATGVAGAGGTEEIEGVDARRTPEGDATSFQVTVGDDGTNTLGPISGAADGEVAIEVGSLGIDGEGNVVMSAGEVGEGEAIPAEALEVTDVREGTEDECAALLADMQQPSTEAGPAVAATEDVTKTAP
jgi:hypothetical protein